MSKIQVNEIVNHFDTGAPDCPKGLTVTGFTTFSGGVSIGGTLTYEDVTNIDSVGIITAQSGLHVTGGNVGIGTASPDDLLHISSGTSPTIRIEDTSTSGAVNDIMGAIEFEGNDASTNASGIRAKIEAEVRGVGGQTDLVIYAAKESVATAYEAVRIGSTALKFRTNDDERMRLDSSGRLGIGTISWSGDQKLIIYDNPSNSGPGYLALATGDATPANNINLGAITYNASNGDIIAAIRAKRDGGSWTDGSSTPTRLEFSTTANSASSATERMRIDSSGLVTITKSDTGNALPNATTATVPNGASIDLKNTSGTTDSGGSINGVGLGTKGRFASMYFLDGASDNTGTGGHIAFATKSGKTSDLEERMRLDSTGDLCLQTTTTSNYTQTSGDASWVYSAQTSTARGTVIQTSNADIGWSMMYMNKFAWSSGDDGRYITFYKNGTGLSSIELNTSGLVDYNTGSDYRLKENIVPMTNGITRIKQLLPKQFNMIDDPDNNLCDGFLAHEAQTVVPQAVCGTHNGMRIGEEGNEVPDYQAMDYGKLTPLLTAALQEAIAKIETLEAKVAALEGN